MTWLPIIFCLIVATAGWYYMFYTHAADNLASVEASAVNRRRVRLRRVGGFAMILLALLFYYGVNALEYRNAAAAAWFLFAVLALMMVIIALGLYDLRLTNRIRRAQHRQDEI